MPNRYITGPTFSRYFFDKYKNVSKPKVKNTWQENYDDFVKDKDVKKENERRKKRENKIKNTFFYGVIRGPISVFKGKPSSITETDTLTTLSFTTLGTFGLGTNVFNTKEEAVEYAKKLIKEKMDLAAKQFMLCKKQYESIENEEIKSLEEFSQYRSYSSLEPQPGEYIASIDTYGTYRTF